MLNCLDRTGRRLLNAVYATTIGLAAISGCGGSLSHSVNASIPRRLQNAAVPLTTPTYDNSGQAMHPGIVIFDAPWHGYTYWMSMTPYTNWDASKENPSILASNDGQTWVLPHGLVNPIATGLSSNLADPDLFYDDTSDQLWLYYIDKGHPDGTHLVRRTSANGVTWTEADDLFHVPANQCLSPAIGGSRQKYYLWCVNAAPAGYNATSSTVELRTSADGLTWSVAQSASISQPGYVIWHIDVTPVAAKRQFWMIAAAFPVGTNNGHTRLFFATSRDGIAWQTFKNPALSPGNSWDSSLIYHSTILYDPLRDRLRLWYSAASSNTWGTGYTEGNFTDLLTWLQQ